MSKEKQYEEPTRTEHTISTIIDDEIIRLRVRELKEEPKPSSRWSRLVVNPLIAIVVGFILTGVVGAYLTDHYNSRQKELEFELANKQRDREREKDERQKALEFERNEQQAIRDRDHDERQKELEYQRNMNQRQREREQDERQKELEYQRGLNQKELEREKDARLKALEFERALHQKEIERERSFADELNKRRIEKIAEAWQQIFLYESMLQIYFNDLAEEENLKKAVEYYQRDLKIAKEKLVSASTDEEKKTAAEAVAKENQGLERALVNLKEKSEQNSNKRSEALEKLSKQGTLTGDAVVRNRFWLGEDIYADLRKYIIEFIDYLDSMDQASDFDLEELDKQKQQFLVNITNIRDKLLKQ